MTKLQDTLSTISPLYKKINNRVVDEDEVWTHYRRIAGKEQLSELETSFVDAFNHEAQLGELLLSQYVILEIFVSQKNHTRVINRLQQHIADSKSNLENKTEQNHGEGIDHDGENLAGLQKSLDKFQDDPDEWCDYLLEQFQQFVKLQAQTEIALMHLPFFKQEGDDREN